MKKQIKTVILSATLIGSMALLGGCGSNSVGYVDINKISTTTSKALEVAKEIDAKDAELSAKVNGADASSRQKVEEEATQEFEAFTNAKNQELRQYFDQQVAELVKEKKLDVVLYKGAVVGGGVDVTDDLINKMGKASDEDIKAAEEKAKAIAAQQAQLAQRMANAQQAGAVDEDAQ